MPIQVKCYSCGTSANAPDAAIGKQVKCPKCGEHIAVSMFAGQQGKDDAKKSTRSWVDSLGDEIVSSAELFRRFFATLSAVSVLLPVALIFRAFDAGSAPLAAIFAALITWVITYALAGFVVVVARWMRATLILQERNCEALRDLKAKINE